jgi:hypothetical protein
MTISCTGMSKPRASLLSLLLVGAFAGYAADTVAFPVMQAGGVANGGTGSLDPSACVDLSSIPINYGVRYSMDDFPAGTDPASVTTVLEDIFSFAGGCTGCHNGSMADGGSMRFNQPSSVLRLVYTPSYRNTNLTRVIPGDGNDSLLYAMLNCTPPDTYPQMPPSMSGTLIDISLRAAIYDWIESGAIGVDQDGNPGSDVVFRNQMESDRLQRFLPEPPP